VSNEERFETDLKFKINSIKIPTLIVWGEDDEMLHVSGARLLADNIENSQLKIIENCNHVLQLDQPKKTAKFIMDFVKDATYAAY
jgi:pimeloyl-ACP methyl ester carboxylesterase